MHRRAKKSVRNTNQHAELEKELVLGETEFGKLIRLMGSRTDLEKEKGRSKASLLDYLEMQEILHKDGRKPVDKKAVIRFFTQAIRALHNLLSNNLA
jgi:hypothetical protein